MPIVRWLSRWLRTGSREPQTLARLQHTHIVPVHSYRTDPVTGLHLLCMPYFGRVTLARLLEDSKAQVAPTGAALLEVLDRLDPVDAIARTSSARLTLSQLTFARVIAFWGAKLAEALAHAHDRGVLHRDIKPSNVLVTGDGLPMLLDFNLAGEPWAERQDIEPDHLGGTLAYMAPEHLEAVAQGQDDRLDARADIFSLGVLLFEALTGSRPFPSPNGRSLPEALQRAAEDRRREPPWICVNHPEIPAPLERVIRRCLAPTPAARYPHANELAADLQAVADDQPLKWTREPLLVRAVRKARRSWRKAVLVAVVTGSLVALVMSSFREGDEQRRIASSAQALLDEGMRAFHQGDFPTASARFEEVKRLTNNRLEMLDQAQLAARNLALTQLSRDIRARADLIFDGLKTLRYQIMDGEETERSLVTLVGPFRVFEELDWNRKPQLGFLDDDRKSQLIRQVDEIFFQFVVKLDPRDRKSSRRGIDLCDRVLAFTDDKKPWQALRSWLDDSPLPTLTEDPETATSAKSCYEWAMLDDRLGKTRSAAKWLERATWLEPGNSWYEYRLASILTREDAQESISHYRVAISWEPDNPRFRLDRARAYHSIGKWELAREDEEWASRISSKTSELRNQPSR